MRYKNFLCLVFLGMVTTSVPVRAALVITLQETGANVVATVSGSINSLVGATLSQTGASSTSYNGLRPGSSTAPTQTLLAFSDLNGTSDTYNNYTVTSSPNPMFFGNGSAASTTFQTASSGSISTDFFVRHSTPGNFWIKQSYVLGTPITGSVTWANKTFSNMGIVAGTYVWSWATDSITLNAVPEPSSVALLALGIGGLVALRRFRRSTDKD